jgi:hypothetical protein
VEFTHPTLMQAAEIFQKYAPHAHAGCGNFSIISVREGRVVISRTLQRGDLRKSSVYAPHFRGSEFPRLFHSSLRVGFLDSALPQLTARGFLLLTARWVSPPHCALGFSSSQLARGFLLLTARWVSPPHSSRVGFSSSLQPHAT